MYVSATTGCGDAPTEPKLVLTETIGTSTTLATRLLEAAARSGPGSRTACP
jgi:hypothetical protein